MAEEEDSSHHQDALLGQKLKSLNAELHSYVVFYNRTSRAVDILWCNYSGEEVAYETLQPKQQIPAPDQDSAVQPTQYFAYSVDTFVSHPWIARDSCTGDLLRVNQSPYYLPPIYDGEEFRAPVNVDIPVFSLKDRCLEEVRKLVNIDLLSSNEIPATIILSLKRLRTVDPVTFVSC